MQTWTKLVLGYRVPRVISNHWTLPRIDAECVIDGNDLRAPAA